jgi:hypothetical protein
MALVITSRIRRQICATSAAEPEDNRAARSPTRCGKQFRWMLWLLDADPLVMALFCGAVQARPDGGMSVVYGSWGPGEVLPGECCLVP